MARDHDIKAPDGYLLGGLRRVRKGGVILFQRQYWQAPVAWVGHRVWVHNCEGQGNFENIEAAPPGEHIYGTESAERLSQVGRPDAKPGYRTAVNKAWFAKMNPRALAADEGGE